MIKNKDQIVKSQQDKLDHEESMKRMKEKLAQVISKKPIEKKPEPKKVEEQPRKQPVVKVKKPGKQEKKEEIKKESEPTAPKKLTDMEAT